MYTYAQILNNKVHWVMQDDMSLTDLYTHKYNKNDLQFIDITNLPTQPQEGWDYDGTKFSAPILYSSVIDARIAKLAELDSDAASAYSAGFMSSASGNALWYDSDSDTQAVINRQYLIALSSPSIYSSTLFFAGVPVGITPVRAKASQTALDSTKTVQYLTASQMVQLGNDMAMTWSSIKSKLWTLQAEVNAATTISTVQDIAW